jgi:hypothetical protein
MAQKANAALQPNPVHPPVGQPYPPSYNQGQVTVISYGHVAPPPVVTVISIDDEDNRGYPERKNASSYLITAAVFNLVGYIILGSVWDHW